MKEVCDFRNNHWRLHSNWNCVCVMLIANVCDSFEVREEGQGDIDIRISCLPNSDALMAAGGPTP